MGSGLTALMGGALSRTGNKYFGAYIGIVVDSGDPIGKGRVKVRLPAITADGSGSWARVCRPFGMAAGSPQAGTQVVVVFEGGDVNYPIVLGRVD